MSGQKAIYLHEEVLLLALRNKDGTIEWGTMYQHAIGGAVLAELLLNNRIEVGGSDKRKLINLVSAEPLGAPLLDECLEKISSAKRQASAQTWVSRFTNLRELKHRIAQELCKRGVLRAKTETILLVFARKAYPEVDPKPEKEMIERLRNAIFSDSDEVDPRTVVLVSLANSADLLKVVFDKQKLKRRKSRIEQVINGDMAGMATKEAIAAMQAAVMMNTVVMPAIISMTINN